MPNVTVTLLDVSGAPVVGARVEAKLFCPDTLRDRFAPTELLVPGVTDANGRVVLAVWANASNAEVQTYYKFRAWHPVDKSRLILDTCAYVPVVDCTLEECSYDCRGGGGQSTGITESAALAAHIANAGDPHLLAGYGKWKGVKEKTASHVLEAADAFFMVEMNVATANTLTVPAGLPVGSLFHARQMGLGKTTLVAGVGLNPIRSNETLALRKQYSPITIEVRAANDVIIYGDLEML